MSRANALLLCATLIAPAALQAQEPEAPDMELLEFLGEWSGEDEVLLQQIEEELRRQAAAPKREVKENGQ